MTPTILTMSSGKGIALLILLALVGCCESREPVPTTGQQQYPCNPYCGPKVAP